MPPPKGFKSKKTLLKETKQAAISVRWKPLNQDKELTRLRGIVNAADDNLITQIEEARAKGRAEGAEERERIKLEAATLREASEREFVELKSTLADLLDAHSRSEILLQKSEDLEEDLLDAELQIEELKLAEQKQTTQLADLTAAIQIAEEQAQLLLATLKLKT